MAAREYAQTFGDADLVVLTDLNVSGRKGRTKRPGFHALLTALEQDEVSAIYSYSLSRLSRSVRDMLALADLCKSRNVPIRLARDADPDPTTATGRAVLGILSVMAQMESDLASERATDTVATRRARGDVLGGPRFEDAAVVIDAYQEAGTATGAAKILTSRGVPTLRGKSVWFPSSVTVILERVRPDLLPLGRKRGVKHAAPFTFYRLLQCHCGTILTGWRRLTGPQAGYVSYRCTRGRLIPHHGPTHIPETRVMAWAVPEMARLHPPDDLVLMAEGNETAQAELRARLARLARAYVEGLLDETAMLAEKAEITDALTRLDLQGRAVRIPRFEWDHEPQDLNRTLRALWGAVVFDRSFRPAKAEWLLPDSWIDPPVRESPPVQRD